MQQTNYLYKVQGEPVVGYNLKINTFNYALPENIGL